MEPKTTAQIQKEFKK